MNYINGSELANKRFIKLENGDLREVPKGKFIPQQGEGYYFLNVSGYIDHCKNDGGYSSEWILKHHPVFRTEYECFEYRGFLETLDEYIFEPDWRDDKYEKWYLYFDSVEGCVDTNYTFATKRQGAHFRSKEKAESFIAAVGEDAVKRYMFDIWE